MIGAEREAYLPFVNQPPFFPGGVIPRRASRMACLDFSGRGRCATAALGAPHFQQTAALGSIGCRHFAQRNTAAPVFAGGRTGMEGLAGAALPGAAGGRAARPGSTTVPVGSAAAPAARRSVMMSPAFWYR